MEAFALYRFVFEGAFSRRLQPDVSAVAVVEEQTIFLRVSTTVENIGKRRVKLSQEFTRLSVSFAIRGEPGWTQPATDVVLEEQTHVQPGETISDQVWVETPAENIVAVQLELYVTGEPKAEELPVWMYREIVSLVEKQGTIKTE